VAKAETRKKILEAAEKLFSENGFDGAPTKAIAKEAGVTEMTLFNHFSSKEVLYRTIVSEKFMVMEVTSVYESLIYDDLKKDLRIIAEKLIENFVQNKYILMMQMKEKKSFQDVDAFKIEQDPFVVQITPVFKTYEEKGMLRATASEVALMFIASIKGLFFICIHDDKSLEEVKDLIMNHVEIFCNGVLSR